MDVEILVSQMGLGDESMCALGVRMNDEDDGKKCDAESRACCRSWTMRAATSVKTGVSCSSQ